MLFTKEFYEVMDHFEIVAKKLIRSGMQGFKREDKELWSKKIYYTDGEVNKAFVIFLNGYSYGKSNF